MAKRLRAAPDHWSDIVGMPDDWDKKNIQALIDKFCKASWPVEGLDRRITGAYYCKMVLDDAKHSHQSKDVWNPKNIKSKESDLRAVTALPPELNALIIQAYPTMFRDKKHFYWFCKKFPQFMIAEQL